MCKHCLPESGRQERRHMHGWEICKHDICTMTIDISSSLSLPLSHELHAEEHE